MPSGNNSNPKALLRDDILTTRQAVRDFYDGAYVLFERGYFHAVDRLVDVANDEIDALGGRLNDRDAQAGRAFSIAFRAREDQTGGDAVSARGRTEARLLQLGTRLLALDRLAAERIPVKTRLWRAWRRPLIATTVVAAIGIAVGVAKQTLTAHQGLTGSYYHGENFRELVETRRDPLINFDWGDGPPLEGMQADHFSVRWTGFLTVPEDGHYEFMTNSDDGVRVTIGGDTVIDNWRSRAWQKSFGAKSLTAGVIPLRVEYFDDWGDAGVKLFWRRDKAEPHKLIRPRDLKVEP